VTAIDVANFPVGVTVPVTLIDTANATAGVYQNELLLYEESHFVPVLLLALSSPMAF
jgi:hypothetical protein